ncbi:nucleotide exchange factor GrpE [Streptomyces marincola]|uniref:nucleotide exchange factor GrpE n=1 Tax=Streptomyces marincola TaxID=2878388 RepID=UPI001CF49E58|nr:nucleotide exchange factor GrpE [Streptomyces marincola]UCM89289.1 nucleotide exchange factor GrpE [Streptomyces marincola]
MTQDPQGFDKEPEVPEGEATGPKAPAEPAGPDGPAGGEAAKGGDTGAADPQPSARDLGDIGDLGELGDLADLKGPGDLGDAAVTAQLDQARSALQERTQDLQRLQAEFQNYRRRVERDRVAVKEMAVANLLTELLPVLDDIGRARDHGELVGGFKQVAESLETVAAKMGLAQFGKEGEPFDPTVHEALMHSYSPDVTETTCVQILQPGYRIGERTIRPARVGVAEPQPGKPAEQEESAPEKDDGGGPDEG